MAKRDYYEVLGVPRGASRRRDQEGVPQDRVRAASRPQSRQPGRRAEVQGGDRGVRGAARRRASARATTASATRESGPPPDRRASTSAASIWPTRCARSCATSAATPAASPTCSAAGRRRGPRTRRRSPGAAQADARRDRDGRREEDPRQAPAHVHDVQRRGRRRRDRNARSARAAARCARCSSRCSASSSTSATCPRCDGEGRVVRERCKTCGGEGTVTETDTLSVKVPAGVANGNFIPLRGMGDAGPRGGPAGDLIVLIEEKPHAVFERAGSDLQFRAARERHDRGAGWTHRGARAARRHARHRRAGRIAERTGACVCAGRACPRCAAGRAMRWHTFACGSRRA